MGAWRRVGAGVVALAAAAMSTTSALALDAGPTTGTAAIEVAALPTAPSRRATAALPPVTEHALTFTPPSSGGDRVEPASVTQTVQLVVTGGDLHLGSESASVALAPDGEGTWVGQLPPVRVVDARGSHAGWDVRWTVSEVEIVAAGAQGHMPMARVRVEPGAPVVVDGTADGLAAGTGGAAHRAGRTLFGAAPGSGGGTYEAGGTVSLELPPHVAPDGILVRLSYTVA